MIRVSGYPFDIDSILADYPEDSVESAVLRAMSESESEYRYDTPEELRFELRLRKETVEAAAALNRSGLNFSDFYDSICNAEYWERTENGGFRLKEGASPAEAIRDIFQNGNAYATECATAMMIVYYGALLEVYGDELFNETFPEIILMNWYSLDPILREIGIPRLTADILLGDRGYFANPDVDPEIPELQGENVIIMPDLLYYGHGIGITNAERIIRALNSARFPGATQSAYFLDEVSRPNYKRLADIYKNYVPQTPPEPIPLPRPQTEPVPQPEPGSGPQPEPESAPRTEPAPEPDTPGLEPERTFRPDLEVEPSAPRFTPRRLPVLQREAFPVPEPARGPAPEAETETEAETEPKPEQAPQSELKPQAEPGPIVWKPFPPPLPRR